MLKKFKLNNKGFSLLEVLVAVVILGCVAGTLLHAFSTSSTIISKSKKYGEATAASENVQEVVNLFTKAEFVNGVDKVKELFGSDTDMKALDGDTGVNYQVGLQNIKSGDSTFDIKVTYDPGEPGHEEPDGTVVSSTGFYEINDENIAKRTKYHAFYSQPIDDVANPDVLSEEDFKKDPPADCAVDENGVPLYNFKKRIISVNIYTKDTDVVEADELRKIYGEVIYNYVFTYTSDAGETKTWPSVRYSTTNVSNGSYAIIEPTIKRYEYPFVVDKYDPDEPISILIMYAPDYSYSALDAAEKAAFPSKALWTDYDLEGKADSYKTLIKTYNGLQYQNGLYRQATDLIIINNIEGINTNMYIVKQKAVTKDGTLATDTSLLGKKVANPLAFLDIRRGDGEVKTITYQQCEADYKPIIVERFASRTDVTNYLTNTSYRDKFAYFNEHYLGFEGEPEDKYIVNAMKSDKKFKIFTNAGTDFTSRGNVGNFIGYKLSGATSNTYRQTVESSDERYLSKALVNTGKAERFYTVTIDVYKSGAFDPASLTFSGDPIYTFTGSKLDEPSNELETSAP